MMAVMAVEVNPAQIKAKLMPTRIQMMAGLMAVIALMACVMAARNRMVMRHLPTLPTLPTDLEPPLGETIPCPITGGKVPAHDPPAPHPDVQARRRRDPHPLQKQRWPRPEHQGPPQGGTGSSWRRPPRCPGGPRGACGCRRYERLPGSRGCSFGHNLSGDSKAKEGSLVDVARADTVDAELDRLISKRASQVLRPDPDEREEGYMESVRRFNEKRRQMARLEWQAFHCGQAERHRA